jgi:hypothetical protein
MPFQGSTPSASAFLYKLCGSSQPSILRGSDGLFYVVKFNGFPGSRGLANEALGTELIRHFGLPSPEWVVMELSDQFIEENPRMWFWNEGRSTRPTPGPHFASRLIEASDEQRTYQMIPHSWIEKIDNRADFLPMLILDIWANNCDRRQTVFLANSNRRLHASFIDNDFMFGGKFGNDNTCPRRVMIYDLSVYRGLWNKKSVQQWVRKIESITESKLWNMLNVVPEEWVNQSTRDRIVAQLATRRAQLPCLLRDVEEVLSTGYSLEYHRTRNATEPSQIHAATVCPSSWR